MSLVTARQGNKLPYCRRTSSAPLSRLSPSRISPSSASPSPTKSYSAPPNMPSAFQWPSIQEQLNFKDNYTDASESSQNPMGRVSTKEKGVNVHIPHPPQHNRPGMSSEKSTNKELNERQEDKVKRRPRLKSDQWRPVSAFPKMLPTRTSFAAEQTKSEEFLKAKNLEHNSLSTSYTCPLQDYTKSDGGQSVSFSEPSFRQGRDQKMLSKQRGNEREMNAATIPVKRDGLLYKRKLDDNVQVESEGRQKHDAPQRKRRERFSQTKNDAGPLTTPNEHSDGKLEQNVFEEVFELFPAAGSRALEAVSRPPQKAMNFQHVVGTAADAISETKSKRGLSNGVQSGNSSPDSFVAQLIANTEKLTLNDPIETPALQERRKLARTWRKKLG
ncbi:hypothetical protein OS493_026541 [Desmophyllum pertusum]|uniref:Uncharacterized protein n=1 Tax=Desmophyllum pertusum TaxID=174260 RepID=A0A9W9YKU9_9CNID|nr:hypothetical protein OS493_026541 [Desmophyllum pertusum]